MNEGEKNGRAKLTRADVATIREESAKGVRGWCTDLAKWYGVSPSTVSRAARSLCWKEEKETDNGNT